jgi:hypothetical protein
MACPDFETLLGEGPNGHAASCEHCAALLESLAEVDATLEAAYGAISAPPSVAAAVRSRIAAQQAVRRLPILPDVLDFIGWAALLALVAVMAQRFLPPLGVITTR